jgi:ketosteroid isomerase-like protein
VASPAQRITSIFPADGAGETDFKALVEDDGFWARAAAILHPQAEIRFVTPDGGFVGPLAGPFRGPEGFRAAWREWVRAWDAMSAGLDEALESEDGSRVLLLVTSRARLAGSATVVDQPSAALYRLRDGLIVAIDHYVDQEQARRAFEEGSAAPSGDSEKGM